MHFSSTLHVFIVSTSLEVVKSRHYVYVLLGTFDTLEGTQDLGRVGSGVIWWVADAM
jgi:hypothetical protein